MSQVLKQKMTPLAHHKAAQWPDGTNLVLGIWLVAAPWALGFSEANPAALNHYLVGSAIAVLAASAMFYHREWEEWGLVALAGWLIVSPWVLGFIEPVTAATTNALVVGIVVLGLAFWAAMSERTPEHTEAPRAPVQPRTISAPRLHRASRRHHAPRRKAA